MYPLIQFKITYSDTQYYAKLKYTYVQNEVQTMFS